jgi:hypothetical protein
MMMLLVLMKNQTAISKWIPPFNGADIDNGLEYQQ